MEGRPPWWTPRVGERSVLLSLAATPGPLPAAVATRLAEGRDPANLLRAHSPEPGAVAARLGALGLRLMVPADQGWPLDATPPDPPCAWLFVAGPAPPEAAASVAVVGGRRASPLRRAAARSIGAGLARAGWCVVSGGAVGVDAAAHAGAVDAGGRTVVVLGCGLDVPYPRANTGLFARVLAGGGTEGAEGRNATVSLRGGWFFQQDEIDLGELCERAGVTAGFARELEEYGLVEGSRETRVFGAQATGCSPIATACRKSLAACELTRVRSS